MLMSHDKEGRLHLALAGVAFVVSMAFAAIGKEGAAIPAMFSVGWSGAHAFILLVRKLRPM